MSAQPSEPFNDDVMLNAIRKAIEHSRVLLDRDAELGELKSRNALLTAREREVIALVVAGLPNKQVGGELGISEITVKAHRGMKADSFPEPVSMAARLRLVRPGPTNQFLARYARSSKPRLRYSPGVAPTTRLNALLNAASDS